MHSVLLRSAPRALRYGAAHPRPISASPQWRSYSKNKSRPSQRPLPGQKRSQPQESQSQRPAARNEPEPAAESHPNEQPPPEDGEQEPIQVPLHDLTKGIPSTIGAELEAASKAADAAEEGGAARPSSAHRGPRRMPASAYETSAEKRKNKIFSWVLVAMGVGAATGGIYMGRNWDSQEEQRQHSDIPSGWNPMLFYQRLRARLTTTMDYINEPAFTKLLPDPDPAWERPYTLVMSLEDMLVHTEWSREHGWRLAKRPGVDYFLRYLSQYYELVIFTSLPSYIADPMIKKLDPYRIIMWPLFREATRYQNGEYIKDLSYLNRDLSKVVLLDTNKAHASLQPENAVILPKWEGKPGDKELVSLIPFLEYMAAVGMGDARKVITSYKDSSSIAAEFAKREAKAREQFGAQYAQDHGKRRGGASWGSFLGIKSGQGMMPIPEMEGIPTVAEGLEKGMMLHDIVRLRGQRQYALLDKEIRENGEKWLQEMAADEKKAQEEAMKGMKAGLTGWMPGSSGKEE